MERPKESPISSKERGVTEAIKCGSPVPMTRLLRQGRDRLFEYIIK
jgi:hypothetical protein